MAETIDAVADLEARLGRLTVEALLAEVISHAFPRRIAVVSSFGVDSAVLLHLVAAVDPATPVLFVDTGRHFPETLAYRDHLAQRLGLRDLRSVGPDPADVSRLDRDGSRATWDPDGCCAFRKVEPLRRALGGFDAWISGRKRFQGAARRGLSLFESDPPHLKVNPLAAWDAATLAAYAVRHDLPPHPLAAEGYRSIGCAPCTAIVASGDDPRAGRWQGFAKTECGIHRPFSPTPEQMKVP